MFYVRVQNPRVLLTEIRGPDDTPYAKGIFKVEVNIPDRSAFSSSSPSQSTHSPAKIVSGGRVLIHLVCRAATLSNLQKSAL